MKILVKQIVEQYSSVDVPDDLISFDDNGELIIEDALTDYLIEEIAESNWDVEDMISLDISVDDND